MPCDKSALLDFLEVLNEDLTRKITLVAAGGTAMTLLDLKPSSILTSQFPAVTCLSSSAPSKIINQASKWTDGTVFSQSLPDDYLEKSKKIQEYSHIILKALHPLDTVVTKIGRLNQRDIQDIET